MIKEEYKYVVGCKTREYTKCYDSDEEEDEWGAHIIFTFEEEELA